MPKRKTNSKPPTACCRLSVGHDAEGFWVVHDRLGLVGGLFADQASALRFARREGGNRPGAVCCLPDTAVLDVFGQLKPLARTRRAEFRSAA